jgi:tetratricopeptide (TPR) repeat protein
VSELPGIAQSEPFGKAAETAHDWFLLAQEHRDSGRIKEAAQSYAKSAELGRCDDEAWYSRLQQARCLRTLSDEGGFLQQALAAFNQRPQRAEPLYDLARFYRERSMYDASALFCEAALALPRPDSSAQFLEDFIYAVGIREEYSIAANYARDAARKDRGHAACNWLALNRDVPASSRNLARSNLFFYAEPAKSVMPSFSACPVGFAPPDNYRPMNPSVARCGERIMLIQRGVNYVLKEDGSYHSLDGAPFRTRNFLLALDDDLEIQSSAEILPPGDLPKPLYPDESAFGDMRLFTWGKALWCTACYRELTSEGWCEQVVARIDDASPGVCRLQDWRVMRPGPPSRHEKNWVPQIGADNLQFIYLCDPARVVDGDGKTVVETIPTIAADQFRGGSQAIAFDDGWLFLIHEVLWRQGRRFYLHRFVWFDEGCALRRVSRTFFFQKKSFEFGAGLAWHPDGKRLLVSYGIDDGESWIATVDAAEVRCLLENVDRLRSGLETEKPSRATGRESDA